MADRIRSWGAPDPDALAVCPGIVANYARYAERSRVLCGGFNTMVNCGGNDGIRWLEQNGC